MNEAFHYCDHCGQQDIQLYFNCSKCKDDLCQKCHTTAATPCKALGHVLSQPYEWIELDTHTRNDDLEQYIKWRMGQEIEEDVKVQDGRNIHRSDRSRFARQVSKDIELLERVSKTILERADGRFLWAKLYASTHKNAKPGAHSRHIGQLSEEDRRFLRCFNQEDSGSG